MGAASNVYEMQVGTRSTTSDLLPDIYLQRAFQSIEMVIGQAKIVIKIGSRAKCDVFNAENGVLIH